jgi:hypothetical protein
MKCQRKWRWLWQWRRKPENNGWHQLANGQNRRIGQLGAMAAKMLAAAA